MVGEPTVEETIEILHGLRDRYEQHHKVKISDAALEAAAKLTPLHLDRFLPDKAIDLIDAGSRVHLANSAATLRSQGTEAGTASGSKTKRRQLRLRILIRLESYVIANWKLKPNCA